MNAATPPDALTLTVNGRIYSGWTAARVSRGLDRCSTDFDVEVSERWTGSATPWRISTFDACTVSLGPDLLMTGYVDDVLPMISPRYHTVRITGRSKTQDLVDCTPDISGGQFSGYSMVAICRAICALFGIGVVDASGGLASATFGDATLERGETGFSFLERLGRMLGVLLSDNPDGDLVLSTAGSTRASGTLIEGRNINAASARLSGRHRYSQYIVKGQHALGVGGTAEWGGSGGVGTPYAGGVVQTQQRAVANDPSVPRYRPRVILAESMLSGDKLQLRANWLRQSAFGHSTQAEITVTGWRQPDGTPWTANQIVPVTSPALGVDRELLVVGVSHVISAYDGRATILRVAPVEAFTPDPGEVKLRRQRGQKGGGAAVWTGAGGQ